MPGKNENRPSEHGMSRAKGRSELVKSIEHVGSVAGGIRFKLPQDVPDASQVNRKLKE